MPEVQLRRKVIRANGPGPNLLITGGVHGDEFEPMVAIRRLAQRLSGGSPDFRLKRGSVTLVPVVNEAAFNRGHRVAEDGLDLARECPGDVHGSTTRRVAHALSQLIHASDYYIDLHTGGTELAVLPMTGYTLHSNSAVLATQRQMAHAFNLPVVWGTAPNLEGRSMSVARDANVPAIYAEFLGSASCSLDGCDAYAEGCLNVMSLLGMIQRDVPESRVKRVVEDPRPGSGHMQVCNPSPLTGFFSPIVQLGESVVMGQQLGMVTDVLGDNRQEILATHAGIVLVLRTFPRVRQGESIGVILQDE